MLLTRMTALAILFTASAAVAAPPPGMPPVTGSMYDGNNAQAPNLAPAPASPAPASRPNDPKQAVTGTGTGTGQGHSSQAGGGN